MDFGKTPRGDAIFVGSLTLDLTDMTDFTDTPPPGAAACLPPQLSVPAG